MRVKVSRLKLLDVNNHQNHFHTLFSLSRFPSKSVVYDKDGNEVKTVNGSSVDRNYPKKPMAVRKGKRNISWREQINLQH
jgi:hypothetical protein